MSEHQGFTAAEISDRFNPHDGHEPGLPSTVGTEVYACPRCGLVLGIYEACWCEVSEFDPPPGDGWTDDEPADDDAAEWDTDG